MNESWMKNSPIENHWAFLKYNFFENVVYYVLITTHPLHLSMVAFMPYKANGRAIKHIDPTGDKGPTLTVYSLAATLKPLLKRIFSTGCNCWVEER
jgi:hypothetical protein